MISSILLTLVAAQPIQNDTLPEYDRTLDEIVVTGTRTPRLLKNTPVQITVISRSDIAKTDATDIQDLLQQQLPGLEFSYAMNQQTHLNFGGFGGQSLLFLVDGERLAGETMDDIDFSRISMNDVERIEIVRGASSALYGGNAAGGVVNIITRKAQKKFGGNASLRFGRHNEQRYGIDLNNGSRIVSNSLSAQYSNIATYDVHSSPDPVTRIITSVYGNKTLNFKDNLTLTPFAGLELSARAGYYFKEIPRVIDTPDRYRDYTAGLRGKWHVNDANSVELSYSFDQYDKSAYLTLSGLDVRNYSNVANSLRGVWNHSMRDNDMLTVGADYRYDYLDNTKLEDGAKHEINADIFTQYDWIFSPKWEVVGAARYDYFSTDRTSRVTPKLSARYKPSFNTNLRVAYGIGFRTPTLKERFYNFDMAGIWIVEGNPDLKPETSHNFNASFDWGHRNYGVTVTTYYNLVSNKITTGLPYYKTEDIDNQLYLKYVNLDRFSVFGSEITLQGRWQCGLAARLSYAYTNENLAKDKDGNTANNQYIPSRRYSLTAHLDWTKSFAKLFELNLGLNGRALSGVNNEEYKDYYDISAGTVTVHYPPYTLWKLSASLSYKKLKLTLAADNIFNYRPKYYYLNAPLTDGINLQVGLNYEF